MSGANWNNPTVNSSYLDVPDLLLSRDQDCATLFQNGSASNIPVHAIRYNRSSNKLQEWDGTTWNDLVLSIAAGGTSGANAAAARTALGIGSLGIQDNSNVNITGGTISGVTMSGSVITSGTVALNRGGTGASLSLGASGQVLQSNGASVIFGNIARTVLPTQVAYTDVANVFTLKQDINYNTGITTIPFQLSNELGKGLYITNDLSINFDDGVDSNTTNYINKVGFNESTTRFRSLIIADGKGNTIMAFDGPSGVAVGNVVGNVLGNVIGQLVYAVINPTISSSVNDWAPTGYASCNVMKITPAVPGTSYSITGIAGGFEGRRLTLYLEWSIGTTHIGLTNNDPSSIAANRILCNFSQLDHPSGTGATIFETDIYEGCSVDLIYTNSRWIALNASAAQGGW